MVVSLGAVAALRHGGWDLAPLFVVTPLCDGWQPYTQMSFNGTDAVFVALDGPLVHGNPEDSQVAAAWVADLSARHRRHAAQLNNHQRWFVNARQGLEIEQKFTLAGVPDIWSLAMRTLALAAAAGMDAWIPEHGSNGGFEQWDFLNHIFEITHPEPERGYIAFIPAVDGSWIIRRKWFAADAMIRREDLTGRVDLGPAPDLAAVIGDRYGLTPAWGGAYRRVRYNMLLESLRSGHVFSVMFDRCTDCSGRVPALHQVEAEYVRSRTIRRRDPAHDGLMDEFAQLTAWTRQVLDRLGVSATEDHLSKLSWLRPAAADLPP
jgi:hypothetical protein